MYRLLIEANKKRMNRMYTRFPFKGNGLNQRCCKCSQLLKAGQEVKVNTVSNLIFHQECYVTR